MRSLPLFRFGARARSTSWGVALCTMFIVASFSVVGGLGNSMNALESSFEADHFLVTKPGPGGLEFFSIQTVSGALGPSAYGLITTATVAPYGLSVTVFALDQHGLLLLEAASIDEGLMLTGPDLHLFGPVSLTGVGTVNADIIGEFESPFFPSDWLVADMSLLESLTGSDGLVNFAIGDDINPSEENTLTEQGFVIQPMTGIIAFLDSGVREVEQDVTWALLPSAFVIAVLAYSFIGTETADRRHEIGVVKTMGAGRRRVLGYLLSNALMICAWGGLLGVGLGIVLSYGMSTVASSLFSSVFIVKASELLLAEAYLVTVAAGLVGALIPAVRMTVSSPVEDLKEVTPSS